MHQGHNFGQKKLGIYPLPLIGSVGEQVADIPQRQAAQQGVAEGVDGHITVGMCHKAGGRRDLHAAQPHGQAIGQGVHVVTVTYSDIHS